MDQTRIFLEEIATPQNFVEDDYLAANPDVAEAVQRGTCWSGRLHFDEHGRREGRRVRTAASIEQAQAAKLERLAPLIRSDLPHGRRGAKYDFLTDGVSAQAVVARSDTISALDYEGIARELVEQLRDGWILDCGAGKRPVYYTNVVNYETVDYESTDVLGPRHVLPFRDASFDALFCLRVLEYARDPYACAAEIVRVLKPGGRLICAAPLLQPVRTDADHYFNMTGQGLRALFAGAVEIEKQVVFPGIGPVQALAGIVHRWAQALSGQAREEFLRVRLGELMARPAECYQRSWVRELSRANNFDLACATMIVAHKPK
jgi:SAM-dependent methyltransferase